MRLLTVAVGLLIAISFSGCADDGDASKKNAATTTAAAAVVTSDEGSITGQVVDAEVVPITGADVAIQGLNATTSDAQGKFTFNALAPGEYVVIAQRLGYNTAQKRVTVVAGEIATVTLSLEPIAVIGEVYQDSKVLDGWVSWGASIPVYTVYLNDDAARMYFETNVTAGLMTVVDTMTWDSTAPATGKRFMLEHHLSGRKTREQGKSPLTARFDEPDVEKKAKIGHQVWLAFTQTTDPTLLVEMAAQQKFTIFVSHFYGEPAPEGFVAAPE